MNAKKLLLLLIIFVSVITVLDLLHPGMPITHDGKDHVARIANFYTSLSEGNIIPRWAGNLNWGYGHPILEFLYPLPSYIASFFHLAGFSFIDSTKLVLGLGMVLSGLCMFLWLSEFLGIWPALIGAAMYEFAPYRFVDVYVRGDIGENLAFVFVPLTLFFLYRFFKTQNNRFLSGGAVSLALLILSHNAISLMFMPIILFYCSYLILDFRTNNNGRKNTKYSIRNILYFFLLGFGLSAFFWIPGLFEGKYTLRNIVTSGEYATRFVSFSNLLYSPWNYGQSGQFSVQLGTLSWIGLLASLFLLVKTKKGKNISRIFAAGLILYSLIAIFIMLPQSQFVWSRLILLQNFQFPWRFLAIPTFTISVLMAMALSMIKDKWQRYISIVLLVLLLFISSSFWHAKGYFSKPDGFFSGIYEGTTDTGESSPIWSTRFMEHRFNSPLEVIGGVATVQQVKRTSTEHVYQIQVAKKAQFLENTVYFPGWGVKIDGKTVPINFQDMHHRGLITFYVAQGKHLINIRYSETRLRLIADVITILSLTIMIVLLFKFST